MKFMMIGVAVATTAWMAAPHAGHHRVSVAAGQSQGQDDRWTWHGRISASGTLDVRDINGSVSSEPASGAEAEVVAIKHAGRHGDPRDVHVLAEERDGGVRICVLYPGSNESDGCDQSGRRHHYDDDDDRNNNDTRVDFEIKLPANTALYAGTVNGDVDVRGASGPVEAKSVNGGVDLETSAGEANGSSVNGSVRAVVTGPGNAPLHFSSVNGAIDVTLPTALNADVEASTLNGAINSDFPITLTGGMMRRQRLNGTIGTGGRRLSLSSVNGSIRLRKTT